MPGSVHSFFGKKVVHILGASGAGTTTLGKAISVKYGYSHFDSDDYFWIPTNPPYTTKREISDRQKLLSEAIARAEKCVLSGSLCGWGDVLIPQFELVIFVDTPTDLRIKRLKEREYRHFGDRILPNGDMYDNHAEFIEWAERYDTAGAEQRSRIMHMDWLKKLNCPVVTVDGTKPTDEMIKQVELCEEQ